jgi:hypothetical protein
MKPYLLIVFIFLSSLSLYSQDKYFIVPIAVVNGDTMPFITLQEVAIQAKLSRKQRRSLNQNEKMVRNVRVTMPLAIACKSRLTIIDNEMAKLPTKVAQKTYYEKAEAQLKVDFENQLMHLSYSQGKMLIKLIDRETGRTPYKLIKQYKTSYSAMFWQSIATVVGMNLNKDYDVADETEIEFIIKWLGYN